MKTVFTYGGQNPYTAKPEALIELRQSEGTEALFIVRYGREVKTGLSYSRACSELGAAILHHLACESIVNNEGV